MKKVWTSLKSFVTVAMIILLAVIIICNLLGKSLDDNILLLFTNLITSVFTFYFTKKEEAQNEQE